MNLNDRLKNVVIDEQEFQITLMPALKAAVLDRKIISMLAPTVGGASKNGGLDAELNLENVLNSLSDGLLKLSDSDYENLLVSLLQYVTTTVPGKGVLQLDNPGSINEVFAKKILTIYKLIFEVMKHNGFSVFGMVGDGLGIGEIFSSGLLQKKVGESGKKSETLGS